MKVTVYTKPDCPQCDWTKRQLDRFNVPYTVHDISTDKAAAAEAEKLAEQLGSRTMPIVVVANGARTGMWSGFRLDRIKGLKETGDY